jgi:hypothetical protein
MPTTPDKDTIYIDIDDEITGIIDKLQASKSKVVALVLPKRASVFQSVVNMKLLKRAADSGKKNIVLITSEAGLLPLAGMAGVHVAKTLTSKPAIPLAPQFNDDHEEAVEEDGTDSAESEGMTTDTAGDQPVGKLAGLGAGAATTGAAAQANSSAAEGVETLVLDDDDLPPEDDNAAPGPKSFEPPAGKKGKKDKKNKKLHIPNFERFRLLLVLGALLLIAAIAGIVYATTALPKATISIKTNAVNVSNTLSLNLSTIATTLDPTSNTIPAKLVQQQKTYAQQATTTGQKNTGTKATGSVGMTANVCPPFSPDGNFQPSAVPAGTGVSSSGLTYITQQATTFSGNGNVPKGSKCITYSADNPTPITAQSPGASYNGANTFTVAGRSDVSANVNTAITGGTDNIVQTVNQNDINGAKAKITTDDSTVKQTLQDQLNTSGYYPMVTTYNAGTPVVTTSANVGDVANNVTVTEVLTYTMFGVHQSDLKAVVDNSVKAQIDTSHQSILSEGLDKATFNLTNNTANSAQLTMGTVATVGPDLDVNAIKQAAIGKRIGEVKSQLANRPGVKSVDVSLSPFWVSAVPKKTTRITVNIAKPTTSASQTNASSP